MSIASEITRIKGNIVNAYTKISDKGGTLPATQNSANLATAIDSIPQGGADEPVEEKDVNFYDYDGRRVSSYTKSEFANLSALPSNPSHSGLTAQGWNWSLSDAKTYVAQYGKLNIGQMYVTNDGKTRIYIHLEEGRLEPYLGFAVNGSVTVDWGDGNTQTVSGTSTSTIIYTQHIYSSVGDYVIKLSSSSKIYLLGNVYKCGIITKNSSVIAENAVYGSALIKIEIGSNVAIGGQAFTSCYSLSSITIPNNITSLGIYAFNGCCSLSNIILPSSLTSLESNLFNGCYSLKNISIPNSITNIKGSCFYNCYSLSNLSISNKVTSITANAFNSCRGIKYYDFSTHTSVPSLANTSAFSNIPSDCKIIVPDNLYDTWIAATNWSTYASYIIKKTDWEAL